MSTLVKITFSRKFRNFLRLAGFAKSGEKLFALTMLIHGEVVNFLKISREIRNEES
ncbi:hypothetical protein T4B_12965 [Trichinella pseudospiralis]|uniref:Uncharacterized protein n=1 Tax=Trichinella pseudospiralis TaxID=6337 RepID=A0A0V1GLI2_TRIPS|nr:hypothetical protein T4B_3593 [Trichinella pseudospiralis]KRY99222.1 hypothetical protein T4B_12965 [Trichinella pseudospiralis]